MHLILLLFIFCLHQSSAYKIKIEGKIVFDKDLEKLFKDAMQDIINNKDGKTSFTLNNVKLLDSNSFNVEPEHRADKDIIEKTKGIINDDTNNKINDNKASKNVDASKAEKVKVTLNFDDKPNVADGIVQVDTDFEEERQKKSEKLADLNEEEREIHIIKPKIESRYEKEHVNQKQKENNKSQNKQSVKEYTDNSQSNSREEDSDITKSEIDNYKILQKVGSDNEEKIKSNITSSVESENEVSYSFRRKYIIDDLNKSGTENKHNKIRQGKELAEKVKEEIVEMLVPKVMKLVNKKTSKYGKLKKGKEEKE